LEQLLVRLPRQRADRTLLTQHRAPPPSLSIGKPERGPLSSSRS
jgi:hypothetical protein